MDWKIIAVSLMVCYISSSQAAKILLLELVIGHNSRVIRMASLGQLLLTRGHQISWLVPDNVPIPKGILDLPFNKVPFNLDIEVYNHYSRIDSEIMKVALENPGNIVPIVRSALPLMNRYFTSVMGNEQLFEKLQQEKFDLVIIENILVLEHYYYIAARLGVPYITFTDLPNHWEARAGWLPSFVPFLYFPFSDDMTFIQRLQNTIASAVFSFAPGLLFKVEIDPEILKKYTSQIENFSGMSDLMARAELILVTKDNLVDYVKPMMANMINIGGFNVKEPKPLPKDLETYVTGAEAGVIVVSFGSILKMTPEEIIHKMLNVFKKIPQTVIWKLNNQDSRAVPENVKLMDWLPQNDLLAHKNVKLFITHCGTNGLHEAIYNGVPMVAMPICTDLPYNAKVMETHGYGVIVDIHSFQEQELFEAITNVLNNPKYSQKIRTASEIFRNQLETPAERAVYWIEHVIKYGGGHLRSHALDMPWWQYLMLDVYAAIGTVVFLVIYIFVKIISFVCSKVCKSKAKRD